MTEGKVQFKCTRDHSNITYEFGEDATMDEMIEHIRCFLLAMGYQPETIEEYFKDDC